MFIGIDQSLTSLGYCITSDDLKILEVGTLCTKERGIYRLNFLNNRLSDILQMWLNKTTEDVVIVREGYSYGSTGQSFELGELGGTLDLSFFELARGYIGKLDEYIIPPSSWKKFIFGSGATKKDTNYMMKAYKATGIEFKNDNEADSYMMVKCYQEWNNLVNQTTPLELTVNQREACTSAKIRKKSKITKAKISKITDTLLKEMIKESLNQYKRF